MMQMYAAEQLNYVERPIVRIQPTSANLPLPAEGAKRENELPLIAKAPNPTPTTIPVSSHDSVGITPNRFNSSISSTPTAVRRVDEFIKNRGITLTNFAGNTTIDARTLFSFRKSRPVKRSSVESIAKVMGLSVDELMKP